MLQTSQKRQHQKTTATGHIYHVYWEIEEEEVKFLTVPMPKTDERRILEKD